MNENASTLANLLSTSSRKFISPKDVADEYGIPEHTQAVWRSANRYGWREFTIKLGRKIAYKREDVENWLESRRGMAA